jgi:prophage regulatory protein
VTRKKVRPAEAGVLPLIVRKKQVMTMLGLSASTLYLLQKAGQFPEPIKLSTRATGWLTSDVERWIASKAAERVA